MQESFTHTCTNFCDLLEEESSEGNISKFRISRYQ